MPLAYRPQSYTVEFVSTLPGDLSTIKDAATTWRGITPDNTIWTFQTFPVRNCISYFVDRPTERQRLFGYSWIYAYNSDIALATITDSFGRKASFDWHDFYPTVLIGETYPKPWPEAISEIIFPDGLNRPGFSGCHLV